MNTSHSSRRYIRSFAWRGLLRRPDVPLRDVMDPRRNTVNVPGETYDALCRIAAQHGTTIRGAAEIVLGELAVPQPRKRREW